MPVRLGEVGILTSPISLVRIWALLSGCLTFSLGSYINELSQFRIFKVSCMAAWCLHFIFTLFVILVEFIQFQTLVPVSWKNLPVTVSTLGTLVYLSTSVAFPWLFISNAHDPKAITAVVSCSLTFLAYASETHLIRLKRREERGYMASPAGLLKVFQVFGGCVMLLLVSCQNCKGKPEGWQFWLSVGIYIFCFLMSLGTVLVMIGDCAGRCLLPFGRLLLVFSHLGVLLYMVVTVISFINILHIEHDHWPFVVTGSIITCLTLIAYTVDLAFSIKLLCDRS
ncbi:myeloid-associated differentiation marker homolog [Conger conger]|uniref:myeloid-associated differentiation marker homolog n=1 Tax=Conger conger TaxID=82655 RepID=UPI002A5ADCCA|nr:myeloid-associated differentiation marker homolog [Conger conger]